MLVLQRITGCLCERVGAYFCRTLSSRVPVKDIASSTPDDINGDVTVLVSLHIAAKVSG